ncbi:MAG: RNA recognition motif domain-containing protein [Candidatus Babeliales bacterium]
MNIYVGNISYTLTEDRLKSLFEQFGDVTTAKIIIDKMTGKSKGFGFVEMATSEGAQAAIAGLNGKEVDGRQLRISEARAREEQPRRSSSSSSFRPRNRF